MTMAFDDQTLSYTYIKQNYMTLKKLKKLNDKNVSHLILKISFLTNYIFKYD